MLGDFYTLLPSSMLLTQHLPGENRGPESLYFPGFRLSPECRSKLNSTTLPRPYGGSTPGGGSQAFVASTAGLHGTFEGALVHLSGEMDGAFSIHRVPPGRVRSTEKLGLKSDTDGSLLRRQTHNALPRIP